ncbi:Trk system potassium transporter TrkA [Polycladidibacter hongkongensis]|uniref:Trk system potassium transporter TrkA n=1 Tax=Polycladidibacter hongkongensis TaxID=1647556 RepID=UPI00082FAF42|nr:Trk system potassium transporter TrkA [Pseudovibrio hongkongensis]
MKVVICGAGKVGYGIAEQLAAEQHDVSVLDTSAELIKQIQDQLDVRGFVGHGAHPDVLRDAGCDTADMIIAVTLHDEINMIACQIAHQLFQTPTKIARVRAQSYLSESVKHLYSKEGIPIDVVISPEIEVGEMILRRLSLPGAMETIRFADDEVVLVGIHCDENCPVLNTPLRQLTELFPDLSAVVVGVLREGVMLVPRSADTLREGDLAYICAKRGQVKRTLGIFGHEEPEARRILIAGGGNIGLYVARRLEQQGSRSNVVIVEQKRDRAMKIAEELTGTVVLNGNALDQGILREADVSDTDIMVALTNDDEVNILSSVMAKQLGCQRNLTLLNNASYPGFARSLGIDSFVNPRQVTVSKVLQQLRRGRIRQVHTLQNGMAEIFEAEILETSPLLGRTLREVEIADGVRVGAIYRRGEAITPKGDDVFQLNDRVVVFALAKDVQQIGRLFRVSLEFF